jgi:hypothetical protein
MPALIYARFVQSLAEPPIPNNRWYLFGDPPTAPVYVYGYLNGAEGPQVTTGPVSAIHGVEVSVILTSASAPLIGAGPGSTPAPNHRSWDLPMPKRRRQALAQRHNAR